VCSSNKLSAIQLGQVERVGVEGEEFVLLMILIAREMMMAAMARWVLRSAGPN
jgi:hypothetical protein